MGPKIRQKTPSLPENEFISNKLDRTTARLSILLAGFRRAEALPHVIQVGLSRLNQQPAGLSCHEQAASAPRTCGIASGYKQ